MRTAYLQSFVHMGKKQNYTSEQVGNPNKYVRNINNKTHQTSAPKNETKQMLQPPLK